MENKNIVILAALLVLIVVGVTLGVKQSQKSEEKKSSMPGMSIIEKARETVAATEKKAEESIAASFSDDLSIESFSKKEFSGTDFTVGEVLVRNSAYARYYITYQSGELKISGIMNVPTGEGPYPVLFLNHGYIDPAVYTNGRGLKREQDYLARQGYVVVHSDYRNHAASDDDPDADLHLRFGYAEDVVNGVLALRAANFSYVDPERVGMLGHSMGGGVAYLIAAAQPELIDAFVLFAPVSADVRDNFEKWTRSRPEVAKKIIEKYGTPSESPAFWDGVSPITQFEKISVPVLIQHGTLDDSTPIEWSEKALAALRAAGRNAHMDTYPGEPHEFLSAWPTVMRRTTAFFDEHVKNK